MIDSATSRILIYRQIQWRISPFASSNRCITLKTIASTLLGDERVVFPDASAETVQFVIITVTITTTSLLGSTVADSHPFRVPNSNSSLGRGHIHPCTNNSCIDPFLYLLAQLLDGKKEHMHMHPNHNLALNP